MTCLPLYTVDAFSSLPFQGNPAAVCLDTTAQGISDESMQKIAAEMNISETAFIRCLDDGTNFLEGTKFGLRWFTPTCEVALCGHATLASATILFRNMRNPNEALTFQTLSGDLITKRQGELISMDLPAAPPLPQSMEDFKDLLELITDVECIKEVAFSEKTGKLLVRLSDDLTREHLESISPLIEGFTKVHKDKLKGVIVTLRGSSSNGCQDQKGQTYDFVSRYFAPWVGIPEDPVTGSAHTVLAPFWSSVLGKQQMYARQCSQRGGDLFLMNREDGRIDVAGPSVVVLEGKLSI